MEHEYKTIEIDNSDSFTYLGMVISREADNKITVNIGGYTQNIVEDYELLYKVKEVTTPATLDLFQLVEGDECLNERDSKIFHTFVARLLYLCKRARPDVQLAELFLCTHVKQPKKSDRHKLDRMIGFLKHTKERKCRICGTGGLRVLKGYIDSALSAHNDGKGHTSMVMMWGDTCILIICCKQKISTKDSTEAELVGISDSFEKLEWAYDFIVALKEKVKEPVIYQDNMSTITIVLAVPSLCLQNKHLTARNAILHKAIIKNKETVLKHKWLSLQKQPRVIDEENTQISHKTPRKIEKT